MVPHDPGNDCQTQYGALTPSWRPEKNGSNILSWSVGAMPVPLSEMSILTPLPSSLATAATVILAPSGLS